VKKFKITAPYCRGPSTGLCAVRTEDGEVQTSPADVERKVSSYFEAFFHGHHKEVLYSV